MAGPVQIMTHEFTPFRGGIGIYVEETARAMSGLGLETTVWAPDYGHEQRDAFSFRVKRIRMRGKQDWGCRLRLARAVKKAWPAGNIPGALILAEPGPIRLWMYRDELRLPRPDRLVVVFHGSELRFLTTRRRRMRRVHSLLDAADCIGVVSKRVGQDLLAHFPRLEEKVVLVSGAVRSSWAGYDPLDLPEENEVLEVLQVGRLHPRKGQLVLVEAAAMLPSPLRERLRIRLVGPIGQQAYADRIRKRIRETGVPVALEGALPEEALMAAYGDATIVVMPSQPYENSIEGLGLALLEAQHFGRPVIGSRIGGIPEALIHNQTGFLVPPADPAALAEALAGLLDDPPLCRRMGEAGARFVRQRFSWPENIVKLMGSEQGISLDNIC